MRSGAAQSRWPARGRQAPKGVVTPASGASPSTLEPPRQRYRTTRGPKSSAQTTSTCALRSRRPWPSSPMAIRWTPSDAKERARATPLPDARALPSFLRTDGDQPLHVVVPDAARRLRADVGEGADHRRPEGDDVLRSVGLERPETGNPERGVPAEA